MKTKIKLISIIMIISSLLLIITLFLSYATATEEHATNLKSYSEQVVFEELDITSNDIINISMVEYARIYNNLSESIFGNSSYGILYVAFVSLIGLFGALTLLFSLIKKPIATIIFNLLSFGVFSLQNFDYKDRGIIPSDTYNWGIAYYTFFIVTLIIFIASIIMLICKIKNKNVDKN